MKKVLDLARLAADDRTPLPERQAAGLALAKLIQRSEWKGEPQSQPLETTWSHLRRENENLTILIQHANSEISTLRLEKQELEQRLKQISKSQTIFKRAAL